MSSFHDRRHRSSQDKLKIRENEKFEKTYRNWQQAKVETKQNNLSHYKERVVLQHSLIRAQDELASLKRDEEQRYREQERYEDLNSSPSSITTFHPTEIQMAITENSVMEKYPMPSLQPNTSQPRKRLKSRAKRTADKASRQAREDALHNICRQSLDDDRKSARARNRSGTKNEKETSSPTVSAESGSPVKSFITEQLRCSSGPDSVSPFRRHTLSPFVDESEEDEKSIQPALTRKLSASLPWHHAQLYHLYGDKADYFLHPKIEPKPQKQIHPKLRNKEEGAGAEALWAGLRNESMSRLRRYDRHVPNELKVPEMPQLLDKSSLQKTQAYRHKLQIMHRSSLTNADRTKVLTYNNPIPDLNNLDGGDSVDRYLPSWTQTDEQVSEADYQKWIQGRQPALENCNNGNETDVNDEKDDNHHEQKLQYLEYPKLKFMTESKSKSNGSFSVKFQEKENSQTQVAESTDSGGVRMIKQTGGVTERDNEEEKEIAEKRRLLKQRSDPRFITKWEPLSMNALVEYTRELSTHGRGSFTHGQSNLWNRQITT